MLARGIGDSDVARTLPRVTAELKHWDGRELPDESAHAALVADIRHRGEQRADERPEGPRPDLRHGPRPDPEHWAEAVGGR